MSTDQAKKTMGYLNSFWDGSPIKRTRVSDGTYILFGRRLSMHLMVQKGVAIELLADPRSKDTGFLARFLMVEPLSRIGKRPALLELPDAAEFDAYRLRIARLLGHDVAFHNGQADEEGRICPTTRSLSLPNLGLSEAAETALRDYYNEIEAQQAPTGSFRQVTSVASKSAEQAARIAGNLAIYQDETADIVDVELMQCGIELARYYLIEAKRLMDRAPVELIYKDAHGLSNWLSERSDEYARFVPAAIQRNGPSGCRNQPGLNKVIGILEKYGHITRLEPGAEINGRRSKLAFALHPQLGGGSDA